MPIKQTMFWTTMILSLFFNGARSQGVADGRTLVSITRFDSMVDIRTLPSLLYQEAGYITDPKISSFIGSAEVKTLRHVKTQVVWTSVGDVDSDTLCGFITNASTLLPNMLATCSKNFAVERSGGSVNCNNFHVNDAGARQQCQLKRLRMGEVWGLIDQYPLREVSVAIIDGHGIDFTDPDLTYARGTFRRSNGDVLNGSWSTVYDSPNLLLVGDHGHNIARVMAAKANNSFGIVGIAPNLKLMGIEVSDTKGVIYSAEVIEGIDIAIDIGVDVISMSIGFIETYRTNRSHIRSYQQALDEIGRRNIILVSAASNDGKVDPHQYPCGFNVSNNICVGGLSDKSDFTLWPGSNYGPQVHIAAFGADIIVKYDWPDSTADPYANILPSLVGMRLSVLYDVVVPNRKRPQKRYYKGKVVAVRASGHVDVEWDDAHSGISTLDLSLITYHVIH